MGIAFFPSRDVKTRDELLKFADQALYQAKREGRNRICLYQHQGYVVQPGTDAAAARPELDRGSRR
jgi:predicted signal transduction protein with EAL and GGDEF domain